MSNFKRRKRLGVLALVFALVFLAGAAFAFIPGILDVVGRVGLREGQYVQWVLAATPGTAGPTQVPTAPTEAAPATTTQRTGFMHNLLPARTATVHGTPIFEPGSPSIYLNHARVITGDGVRERNNQRIEWSVVFNAAGTAYLHAQAMNFSDLNHTRITGARVVGLTDVGVIAPLAADVSPAATGWMGPGYTATAGAHGLPGRHALPVVSAGLNAPSLLSQMFTVGGTYASFVTPAGDTLAPTNATHSIDDASTGIHYFTVTWNGDVNVLAGELDITTWTWVDNYDGPSAGATYWDDIDWVTPPTGQWVMDGTGVTAAERGITILPSNAIAGEVFMTTETATGDPIALGTLEGWVGTFVIELEYELAPAP